MSAGRPGGADPGFTLLVHGGAGPLPRDAAVERAGQVALRAALEAGGALLAAGAPALEAVVAAVRVLEAEPSFNAGRGSVLSAAGAVEMDAAVMEGTTSRAGAVACVSRVAHPVDAALAVLRDGRHVLLCGPGAEAFALGAGVEGADPESLIVPERRAQLERALARAEREAGGGPVTARSAPRSGGTVGAVARDAFGRLAAATSTGGLLAKRPGRISDSAQIGCGTWADDATCAVSATGEGEYFVRAAFAHAVATARGAGRNLEDACAAALERVGRLGGSGGCIALDASGASALPFDTPAMARGVLRSGAAPRVALRPGALD